jgi:hypothetical protein
MARNRELPYEAIISTIAESRGGIQPADLARAVGIRQDSLYTAVTNLTFTPEHGVLAEDDYGRLMYV